MTGLEHLDPGFRTSSVPHHPRAGARRLERFATNAS